MEQRQLNGSAVAPPVDSLIAFPIAMLSISCLRRFWFAAPLLATVVVLWEMPTPMADQHRPGANLPSSACQVPTPGSGQEFLVMAGGGLAQINEISLEKNVLYFQRTLKHLRFNPLNALLYFANGTDGKATVRYLDPNGQERYKPPEIANLRGASTRRNLVSAMQGLAQRAPAQAFLYFTGHGNRNSSDLNNNTFNLWNNDDLTVQEFSQQLDRLPTQTTVTLVMAQCFSGSFANVIYTGGQPETGLAPHTRCGFFATIKENPSVGCTPAVDEADYEDYSSSFFAGLSGMNRLGKPVASADYNKDGKVSYNEAHAFAKIDGQTTDIPVSSLEVWLQTQADQQNWQEPLLAQPMAELRGVARPEQQAVLDYLVRQLQIQPDKSFAAQVRQLQRWQADEVRSTYVHRLYRELINIGAEQRLRRRQSPRELAILTKLLACESGTWQTGRLR